MHRTRVENMYKIYKTQYSLEYLISEINMYVDVVQRTGISVSKKYLQVRNIWRVRDTRRGEIFHFDIEILLSVR